MRPIQIIVHRGRLAAAIVAGQAVVDDTLSDAEFRHVQAMCLYALQTIDGDRPGPYSDADADAYAREALASAGSQPAAHPSQARQPSVAS
jgi:hypothetical protein